MISEISDEEFEYCAVYNYGYYRDRNPDLQQAFGNDRKSYLNHFIEYGMKEGRKAIPNFDVTIYREYNEDLEKEYGNDLTKYYLHYIKYGEMERRKCC